MRVKTMDGPLSIYNGNNPDVIYSPKRINTLQNSNYTTTNTTSATTNNTNTYSTGDYHNNGVITTDNQNQLQEQQRNNQNNQHSLGNINNKQQRQQQQQDLSDSDSRSWYTAVVQLPPDIDNKRKVNINSTLATATFRGNEVTRMIASSVCSSASSPDDDSLLEYEDAHQSCSSSVEASPQEEDRVFDISSDTESLSEEGNVSHKAPLQSHRGIINPNYPGFQHLAHTLDFRIKTSSDTEDEDYDSTQKVAISEDNNTNNNNNNNNNNGDDEETSEPCIHDKIDSVNRLDSVENIQKVFYDKPVLNIPVEDCGGVSSSASNASDEELDKKIDYNIKPNAERSVIVTSVSCHNIVGDFGKEIEQEFGRISRDHNKAQTSYDEAELEVSQEEARQLPVERAVQLELQEAVEKLSVENDLTPAATRYNIEPNIEQPFNKASTMEKLITETSTTIVENKKEPEIVELKLTNKLEDAYLSSVSQDNLNNIDHTMFLNINVNKVPLEEPMEVVDNIKEDCKSTSDVTIDSNKEKENVVVPEKKSVLTADDLEKFSKEDKTKDELEKDEDSAVPRKKEKIDITCVKKRREYSQQINSIAVQRRELAGRNRDCLNRRSLPVGREHKKRISQESLGSFDVYNIETAMPKIDLEAIESHLRAAREEERRRRTDREEIRRRLAMGNEDDYYGGCDRPGRKPSLQARLQSGMNLQICFMNETASDTESPSSDSENSNIGFGKSAANKPAVKKSPTVDKKPVLPATRPATLALGQQQSNIVHSTSLNETDFFTRQARLQTEARMALAQAKEMARMQMEIEKQRQKKSPITEMVRHSLEKVGIPFPEDRRRLSRQILTEMNVAQLQVIVNDLHTQIEILNENLVKFLMDRDDLHMEQDSMLVDIEDLTRFLSAKEQTIKDQTILSLQPTIVSAPITTKVTSGALSSSPLSSLTMKPHLNRIASLVKNK